MNASEMPLRQPNAPRNILTKNQLAAPMFSKFVELTLVGFAHIVTKFPDVVEL